MGNRMVTRDHKMIPYGLIHTVHTNSVKIKIYGKYSLKKPKIVIRGIISKERSQVFCDRYKQVRNSHKIDFFQPVKGVLLSQVTSKTILKNKNSIQILKATENAI